MGFEISLLKFHKNPLSERLLEGKAVTLLDNLTEHKAVFQSFFSVFILGYFLFHPSPLWASK
ncbi:hypothetical protein CPC197_1711 [Chlamydia psittaci C1/97]|nr:hypothetical protein CPC197_1711 [Chlamydia psittaci C1/97]